MIKIINSEPPNNIDELIRLLNKSFLIFEEEKKNLNEVISMHPEILCEIKQSVKLYLEALDTLDRVITNATHHDK